MSSALSTRRYAIGPHTRPARRAAATPLALWPRWLELVLRRMAERRQLAAMDHRELRDIGLSPGEASDLANKPFWRA